MPNGGPDCCGTCGFNRVNNGKWRFPERDSAREPSYCTIRHQSILRPFWTYCMNWHTQSNIPDGPIFTSGTYAMGYCRIPWHDNNEPRICVAGKCFVCGHLYEKGIEVNVGDTEVRQFCCNAHYVRWWKENHPFEELPWDYKQQEPE